MNIAKTENYIEAVRAAGHGVAERRELSDADRAAEALFMGLRLNEGIALGQFLADYGVDVLARHRDELDRMRESGLVEIGSGRLRLTARGRLLSNEVFVMFV